MLPTLNGRIQTRIFLLAVVGSIWTLIITPVLPIDAPLGTAYKDWPTIFGLLTAIPEGLLVWFLLAGGVIPWIDSVPGPAFVIHFVTTWLLVWLVANGPMRVPFIHWRINGGRLI